MQKPKGKKKTTSPRNMFCGIKPEDIIKDDHPLQPKFPKRKSKVEKVQKLIQESKMDFEKMEKECQEEIDATNFSKEQIDEQKRKLHACIDKRLDEIATKLKAHLPCQNQYLAKYFLLLQIPVL